MRKIQIAFVFLLLCVVASAQPVQTGAERLDLYLPLLYGKRIGVTANHTAIIGTKSLVDVLVEKGVDVVRIYAPEHGFRGTAEAGEQVDASIDKKTGIVITSLYGKNYKPAAEQMHAIDYMLFDMQDVGVRFYTYLSTMHYVMEACAENEVPLIVLDRPNPNGFYVDGPVLENKFRSFVGMHPIPVVHGMTLGELAGMINDQGWLAGGTRCNLTVIPCAHYTHNTRYNLPVPPSPNLPNQQSVYLYPSLCLFEGTVMSLGRGTGFPFQVFGHPSFKPYYTFSFEPHGVPAAQHPLWKDQRCYGVDLRAYPDSLLTGHGKIRLEWLLEAYHRYDEKESFFTRFFYTLCGMEQVHRQIDQGMSAEAISASWQPALEEFKLLRKKYLLYDDFE